MTVEFDTAGPEVRLVVRGEVDLGTCDQLLEALDIAVAAAGKRRIDVDLSGVTFLDAAGVRTLIAGHNSARGSGRALRVRGATGMVRQLLEITGVTDLLGAEAEALPPPAGPPEILPPSGYRYRSVAGCLCDW